VPVDPVIQQLLDAIEAAGAPPLTGGSAERARRAFRSLTVGTRRPEHVVEVAQVSDIAIPGPAGDLPARVYRPAADDAGSMPTMMFLHGGGFVIGDLDTHDNQARVLAARGGMAVVSVAYRLAPEHPWPAAVDDAVAAFRWLVAEVQAGRLGGDVDRVVVGGDSAGGNLSAVVAHMARDEHLPLRAQFLLYPGIDFVRDYPSRQENATGYFMTHDDVVWFAEQYLGVDRDDADPDLLVDPRLSPIHGDLAGLAPNVVVTAEFDVLRDEGDAYAKALADAGVEVVHVPCDGMVHGFFDMFTFSPGAHDAVDRSVAALRTLLA
jgi:acetyl esterase